MACALAASALGTTTRAAPASSAGLPDLPELGLVEANTRCVVHYTLAGIDAAPDRAYARAVARWIDATLRKTAKTLRAPLAEPGDDDGDRLHVYLRDTSLLPETEAGSRGFAVAVAPIAEPGFERARTSYLVIDAKLSADLQGKTWRRLLKATCAHQAMHAVQFAYNATLSSWALEGMAVWGEQRFGRVSDGMLAHWHADGSMFTSPAQSIWKDSPRKYSTSPLFAFLEQHLGKLGLQRFLEAATAGDDAWLVLHQLLELEDDTDLEAFWLEFAGRLAAKRIRGLKKSLMPDLAAIDSTLSIGGFSTFGSLPVGSIRVFAIDRPDDPDFDADVMLARSSPLGSVGTQSAVGVLVDGRGRRTALTGGTWHAARGMRRSERVLLLVTSAAHEGLLTAPQTYVAGFFAPLLRIDSVVAESPVVPAGVAAVTLNYDLSYVPGPYLDVSVRIRSKGPKQADIEVFNQEQWAIGLGQQIHYLWQAPVALGKSVDGRYRLAFEVSAPGLLFGATQGTLFAGDPAVRKARAIIKVKTGG